MTHTFGKKDGLYVEISGIESRKSSHGFISMSVNGLQVSAADELANLSDIAIFYSHQREWRGKRISPFLSSLSDVEALEYIYGKLYGTDDRDESEGLNDWKLYERYLLTPNFPPFNGWFGAVLDEPGCQRLMAFEFWSEIKVYKQSVVEPFHFDSIIDELLTWIEVHT